MRRVVTGNGHHISIKLFHLRIFMIEKGTTVESGSHEELFQLKGKYFKLVEAQHLGTK